MLELTLADKDPVTAQDIEALIVREFLCALEDGRDDDDSDAEISSNDILVGLLDTIWIFADQQDLLKFQEAEQLFHETSCKVYCALMGCPQAMKDSHWMAENGWWPDELPKRTYPKNLIVRLARLSAMHDAEVTKDLRAYAQEMKGSH